VWTFQDGNPLKFGSSSDEEKYFLHERP
jgi:hypothetical protein